MKSVKEDFYKWMSEKEETRYDRFRVIKAITCQDGFTISVQCSGGHYCSPRIITAIENYKTFEVGFPSEKEDLLMEYAEDPENPTETVYGYVPLDVILKVIEKHGGIFW